MAARTYIPYIRDGVDILYRRDAEGAPLPQPRLSTKAHRGVLAWQGVSQLDFKGSRYVYYGETWNTEHRRPYGFVFEHAPPIENLDPIVIPMEVWQRLARKAGSAHLLPVVARRPTGVEQRVKAWRRLRQVAGAYHAALVELWERTSPDDRGVLARQGFLIDGREFYLWELLGVDATSGRLLDEGYAAPHLDEELPA